MQNDTQVMKIEAICENVEVGSINPWTNLHRYFAYYFYNFLESLFLKTVVNYKSWKKEGKTVLKNKLTLSLNL